MKTDTIAVEKNMIISIASDRGGIGKATLSSALSSIIKNSIIVDCNVYASNLHLILDHYGKMQDVPGRKQPK